MKTSVALALGAAVLTCAAPSAGSAGCSVSGAVLTCDSMQDGMSYLGGQFSTALFNALTLFSASYAQWSGLKPDYDSFLHGSAGYSDTFTPPPGTAFTYGSGRTDGNYGYYGWVTLDNSPFGTVNKAGANFIVTGSVPETIVQAGYTLALSISNVADTAAGLIASYTYEFHYWVGGYKTVDQNGDDAWNLDSGILTGARTANLSALAVPGPIAAAGLPGLVGLAGFGLARRRRAAA